MVSCAKTPTGNSPIMPIHYMGEKTHLYITDYIPALSVDDPVEYSIVRGNYTISNMQGTELDLEGDNEMGVLRVHSKVQNSDIVILPKAESVQLMYAAECNDNQVTVRLTHSYYEESSSFLVMVDNEMYCNPNNVYNPDSMTFTIALPKRMSGRHYLRVYAYDFKTQILFNDLLIPLQDGKPVTTPDQLNRHDDQAQILYSILIDRFHNGNTANDWKMNSPEVLDVVDYQGGDLAGITAKIREGFFDELGISTLWISPITQNPYDAWGCYTFEQKADGTYDNKYDPTRAYTKFSGYHGYWPIYITALEKRFGTDDELRELLATAHDHNMNVVLDYVANHMHINAPFFQEHPDWHTDSILPDGRRNFELWDEARLTTWFDVHIPSLDLEKEYVYEPMTDSALFWLEKFDFDGFRHDACKHIPEIYWRTFGHKLATRFPNRHIWMIGETYGSPELINGYVKTGMLNAQFDFNVYYAIQRALLGEQPLCSIEETVLTSLSVYGAHHTMGTISGNHDQLRSASLFGGAVSTSEDGKRAGWTRTVGIGDAETAYRKAMMQEMINMTLPGVPCIYQGDEYAEVGANDPDNRMMLRFDGLNEQEQLFRSRVQQLIALRRSHMALLYGDFLPSYPKGDEDWTFTRRYLDDVVTVTISRTNPCTIMVGDSVVFAID